MVFPSIAGTEPTPMPDSAHQAVFLSYASQDAEAARRICEALRRGGVEVWFDADGGLEHGDEWDREIRRQIKDCALFIPLISAATQARPEGYFRLEWELAAQRAMSIASGVPFILPVVIDGTREPEALVPDRFRAVQWTRLPGGAVSSEVQARLLKLWSHRLGILRHEAAQECESAGRVASGGPAAMALSRFKASALAVAVIVIAVVVAGGWLWLHRQVASAAATAAAASLPAPPAEAEQLRQQARGLIYDPDSARNEFALAENLLHRATEVEPNSGAAWGVSALLNVYSYSRAYDLDRQRLVRAQTEAGKALVLAPGNIDALLALGLDRQVLGEPGQAKDYLDRAQAADPQNVKVILAQSLQISDRSLRAKFLLDAAGRVSRPAELFYYAAFNLQTVGRLDEAKTACDRALEAKPFWRALVERSIIEYLQTADPAKVSAWLDKVPELRSDEPRVAVMDYNVAMLRRDPAAAIRALTGLAADYFEDNLFTGPKAYLLAQAEELAGQPERAAEQWQLAETAVREKLRSEPGELRWRTMLPVILAGEHRLAEAKADADACAVDDRLIHNPGYAKILARAYVGLGEPSRAIAILRGIRQAADPGGAAGPMLGWLYVSAPLLAADPQWDSLRGLPEYAQLVDAMKRAGNESH
jgi:tetratricopeptide (TPR) repeat protein